MIISDSTINMASDEFPIGQVFCPIVVSLNGYFKVEMNRTFH